MTDELLIRYGLGLTLEGEICRRDHDGVQAGDLIHAWSVPSWRDERSS